MIEGVLAAGHIALDTAEIAGGEGRVHMEGVGADLNLDPLFPHAMEDVVAVFHVNAEGLKRVVSAGCC